MNQNAMFVALDPFASDTRNAHCNEGLKSKRSMQPEWRRRRDRARRSARAIDSRWAFTVEILAKTAHFRRLETYGIDARMVQTSGAGPSRLRPRRNSRQLASGRDRMRDESR
jgi:hypothetical protein